MTTLKLPERTFKAYLFDCDGTIVDSMPLQMGIQAATAAGMASVKVVQPRERSRS